MPPCSIHINRQKLTTNVGNRFEVLSATNLDYISISLNNQNIKAVQSFHVTRPVHGFKFRQDSDPTFWMFSTNTICTGLKEATTPTPKTKQRARAERTVDRRKQQDHQRWQECCRQINRCDRCRVWALRPVACGSCDLHQTSDWKGV